jgi:hypothetical protein
LEFLGVLWIKKGRTTPPMPYDKVLYGEVMENGKPVCALYIPDTCQPRLTDFRTAPHPPGTR